MYIWLITFFSIIFASVNYANAVTFKAQAYVKIMEEPTGIWPHDLKVEKVGSQYKTVSSFLVEKFKKSNKQQEHRISGQYIVPNSNNNVQISLSRSDFNDSPIKFKSLKIEKQYDESSIRLATVVQIPAGIAGRAYNPAMRIQANFE